MPRSAIPAVQPTSIDAYALDQIAKLQASVRESYERYEFRRAHQMLYDFCNDTLSAFYCAATKDRLYCDAKGSQRRRATQHVMWRAMEVLTRLLAPIMPHTADEAYRALWKADPDRSIHMQTYFDPPVVAIDADWPKALEARDRAFEALEEAKKSGIENPLDAEVMLPDPEGILKKFAADFADMLGVSRVRFVEGAGELNVNDLRNDPKCDRCWRRDRTCAKRSDGGMLCDRCAGAVGVQ